VIKLTSMGDLMHALPALTDAAAMHPGIEFDWVVDESFAEVPSWHPAVRNIYKSAHRRWRKEFLKTYKGKEVRLFFEQVNSNDYELVIDAQNNLKSAFISLMRKGPIHGMDGSSVAEKPAHWAYKHRHYVDTRLHAITRQRALFAFAMGYGIPDSKPDYGLRENAFTMPALDLPEAYIVLVHNASWKTKLWPNAHWHKLINLAAEDGYSVVLPGGNQEELARAKQIAGRHDNAIALPRLSLSALGGVIRNARGAVNCDTGLAHLTAMIGTPAITLYGPTSDKLIGTTGQHQQHLVAADPPFHCAPCYKRTCHFEKNRRAMSSCMQAFEPGVAWSELAALMKTASKGQTQE
jgi:heptosyltransferase-1